MSEEVKTTLEEWKKEIKKNPEGFMFELKCKKCNSFNVAMEIEGTSYGGGGGCETCGYGGEGDASVNVLIKCKDCGNAFNYEKESD